MSDELAREIDIYDALTMMANAKGYRLTTPLSEAISPS
jgi:hypothetical protein